MSSTNSAGSSVEPAGSSVEPMDGVRQGSELLADTEAEFVQRRQVADGVRQGAEHLLDIKAESVQRTELDCEDFRKMAMRALVSCRSCSVPLAVGGRRPISRSTV